MPGDPIQTLIQTLQQNYIYNAQASTEIIARYKHEFGLDGNLLTQYLTYMQKLILHGDLGPSLINYPTPAQTVILRSLPWTIGLLGISAVLAWILGIAIGAVAGAARQGRLRDRHQSVDRAVSRAVFFVALVLVYIFAYSMVCCRPDRRTTPTSIRGSVRSSSAVCSSTGCCQACRS